MSLHHINPRSVAEINEAQEKQILLLRSLVQSLTENQTSVPVDPNKQYTDAEKKKLCMNIGIGDITVDYVEQFKNTLSTGQV